MRYYKKPINQFTINLAVQVNRRFLFYCDGNKLVGFGHFSRCLTIATELKKYPFEVSFCGNYDRFSIERLSAADIPYNAKMSADMSAIVLVDSYHQTEASLLAIKHLCMSVLVIDDFDEYRFSFLDGIINVRVAAEQFVTPTDKHILGVKYFPFSPELRAIRHNNLSIQALPVTSILIALGAKDRFKVMDLLIETLDSLVCDVSLTILSAEKPVVSCKNNTLKYFSFVENMADFYQEHDVVISGGGSIKYEAGFCMRANAAISQTVEQRHDTLLLQQHNVCFDLGLSEEVTPVTLKQSLASFLDEKIRIAQLQCMQTVYCSESLTHLVNMIMRVINVRN